MQVGIKQQDLKQLNFKQTGTAMSEQQLSEHRHISFTAHYTGYMWYLMGIIDAAPCIDRRSFIKAHRNTA